MEKPKMKNKIPYLSPSAFKTYQKSKDEYYLCYLAPVRAPRFPQTQPMSIGSAFDAYVKSYLHEKLVGDGNQAFELRTLFEAQVEPQHRDWAWEHGSYLFESYRKVGALADLMLELDTRISEPRFEFRIEGKVQGVYGEVILLGKPDVFFINKDTTGVLLDFKVNGYCSKSPTSPTKGYIKCRSLTNNEGSHKDSILMPYKGMTIAVNMPLNDVREEWAEQMTIYAWLLGQPVGSDFVAGIEQLACKPAGKFPHVRYATHRSKLSADYQNNLFKRLCEAWSVINSDHFFRDLTFEESQRRCEMLDAQAQRLANPDTPAADRFLDDMFREANKPRF